MIYADEELLEQENELNTVAMEIILHAGHAKTLADEAFQLAKEEKFKKAYERIEEATTYGILKAHQSKCKLFKMKHKELFINLLCYSIMLKII